MQAKEILFDEDARMELKNGIEQFADAVAVTLGPKGRIAKEMKFKIGAELAKEMAAKIKERAGDGTATGVILFRSLVREGLKHLTHGISPILIHQGIQKALEAVLKEIKTNAIPAKEHLRSIIEPKIAECLEKTDVVVIEEGNETAVEIVKGMELNSGYLSPYFITNQEKRRVELHRPHVLVVNKKISSAQEILSILQQSPKAELLIIAEDIEGDALATLVMNKLQNRLKVAAIKATKDLSIGARVDEALITKEKTILIGTKFKETVAILKVKEKREIFEESLNLARAALEEGLVLGGGIALLKAAPKLNLAKEEMIGAQILLKALTAPFRQIAQNSGLDSLLILGAVLKKGKNFGFNAVTEQVEDLFKAGIFDPAKVVRIALEEAVAAAGVVLLSEALIV
jgi:chaperonin GroEL